MKTLDLIQGSPEWHAHRARHFNASDAPAMLGCSKYMNRTELLHAIHTGLRPEPSPELQLLYDKGHAIEAAKRPLAEVIVGEELYPVTGSEGELSASFDGLTMLEDTNWECKSLNADLRSALPHPGPEGNHAANLPKAYRVQMEQQCAVAGCTRVLFTASDGRDDDRHCWYTPDPVLRAEIMAGWKQFAVDLANYKPPAQAAGIVVAAPIQALPSVSVVVEGSIVIRENFDAFEVAARDFLEHRLIREPKSDQDFADLEVQIKAMKGAEAALDASEDGWIAQIEPVSMAKRRKDMLHKLMRDNRLMAEKLLASEKERRRGEIVAGGIGAFQTHITALNERLGRPYMPLVAVDFAGVIKGKKSLASMEDAVAGELARGKIAANAIADQIDLNLKFLREHADGFKFLFNDAVAIVLKQVDDLQTLVRSRIAEHKADQEKAEAETRERIRKEEADRLQEQEAEKNRMRMSEISGIQQQVMIATLGRAGVRKGGTIECIRETLAETEGWVVEESSFGPLTSVAQAAKDKAVAEIRDLLTDAETSAASAQSLAEAAAATAPVVTNAPQAPAANSPTAAAPAAANVVPIQRPAPAATTPPTLRLGQLNDRFGLLHVTADDLTKLGFPPAAIDKAAKLYHEADFSRICDSIVAHVRTVQDQHQRQVA